MVAIDTASADETEALGRKLGELLIAGDVVLLHGDLGAGKTTLTRGIAAGLGIVETIQSPTFALVSEHRADSGLRLFHIDLYRLDSDDELASFGFEEYLAPPDGVTVIEWPDRAGTSLPGRYTLILLEPGEGDRRRIRLRTVPAGDLARFHALASGAGVSDG
jgi:tRNA threonylcarbamoyladenosine biosynthesis protein TsaE